MFDIALQSPQRLIRRFRINHQPNSGWEVVDESDTTVLRRSVYDDWHRVERAIADFKREEAVLEAGGWVKI